MENRYLVLSDVHGNLSALEAVLDSCSGEDFDGVLLLGDLIDYGMRSNEVIELLSEKGRSDWDGKVLANIWGNHERLIVAHDLERLSSDRGREMARYTADHLDESSVGYIHHVMDSSGMRELELCGLRCLAVHGSLDDPYWKAIEPDDLHGNYEAYDLVLSGHSHHSHCFANFYPTDDPVMRNQKVVTFVNPGSVGQPRNHNPLAQYAVLTLPSRRVELGAVPYDVAYEQSLYPVCVDSFYRDRLANGV